MMMRCPKCRCELKPWPWEDGGYKGVQCSGCLTKWWSEKFAGDAHEAAKCAVDEVVALSDFPTDAVTDEEQQKRWKETLDG